MLSKQEVKSCNSRGFDENGLDWQLKERDGMLRKDKVPPFGDTFMMAVLAAINVALEKGYMVADGMHQLPDVPGLPVPEAELQTSVSAMWGEDRADRDLRFGTILVYTIGSMPDEAYDVALELPVEFWDEGTETARVNQRDFLACLSEIGRDLLGQVQGDDGTPINAHEYYYGSIYYPVIKNAAVLLMMGDPWEDGPEVWATRGIRMALVDARGAMWRNLQELKCWGKTALAELDSCVDRTESLVEWWGKKNDRRGQRTLRIERAEMESQLPMPF